MLLNNTNYIYIPYISNYCGDVCQPGNVIKAWDIGVATMKKGELAVLLCKSEYAYGAGGSPPKIPANATLVFEVELFDWAGEEEKVPFLSFDMICVSFYSLTFTRSFCWNRLIEVETMLLDYRLLHLDV